MLPGFSASSSLYRSRQAYAGYSASPAGDVIQMDHVIEPAAACNPTRFQSCLSDGLIPFQIREAVCNEQYGLCLPGDSCCDQGENGHCADLKADSQTCGGCHTQCETNEVCCNGTCCAPESCCDNACINLASDPDHCGTCGTSCGTGQCCVQDKCIPPPDQLGNSGQNNYVLNSPSCQPIEGLTVSMQVQAETLTTSNGGFSMQLNAYNTQPITSNCPTNWMQFIIQNVHGNLSASIQYSVDGETFNGFEWLPLKDMSGNPISNETSMDIGQKLKIALDYDESKTNITGADFFVTGTDGETVLGRTHVPAPEGCLYPMLAFQVNVVSAPALNDSTRFSGRKGVRGTITYSTSGQQLCNEGATVGNTLLADVCSGTWVQTDENANVTYGAVSSCCGSELTQPFLST
jgi:hypothetical protein